MANLLQDVLLGDATNDPDIYDINVVAWDYGLTPLHFAILNGHLNVIELLISEYGADVLLPVKLDPLGSGYSKAIIPKGAIMTITLAAMCQPTQIRLPRLAVTTSHQVSQLLQVSSYLGIVLNAWFGVHWLRVRKVTEHRLRGQE